MARKSKGVAAERDNETRRGSALPRSHNDRAWLAIAVIVAAVIAAFYPSLTGKFTTWDDEGNIVQNPFLHPVSLAHLWGVWSTPFRSLYIPLVYTSYAAEMALGGAAWIFHVTNLALHCGSAVLVFLILRELLGRKPGMDEPQGAVLTLASAMGALVFAVHPLQAEPVSWITGRKDVLSGFMGFAAVLLYLKSRNGTSLPNRKLEVCAVLCFTLSLLAKPAAVALPLAVLVLDIFARCRTPLQSLARLWPWFLIAFFFVAMTVGAQPIPDFYGIKLPLWQRPIIAADSFWFYVEKLIAPVRLSPVYGRLPWDVMKDPFGWVKVAAAVAFIGVLSWRRGPLGAGGFYFIASLLPVLGFLPFVFQTFSTVADRYVYASMFGVSFLVAAGLLWLGLRSAYLRPAALIAGGIIALFVILSNRQCRFWNNSEVLWKRAVAIAPNSAEPHSNLGNIYHQQKRYADAEREFRKAIELKPDFGEADNNLGLAILDGRGDAKEAAEWFQRSIAEQEKHGITDVRYAHPVMHLGVCWLRLGRVEDAEKQFRMAIKADPGNYVAHLNLGIALNQEQKRPEALEEFNEAARLRPGDENLRKQIQGLEGAQ